MTSLLLVFMILSCVPSIRSGLMSPCGNGCFIRISPLTNELHCDCSGRAVIRESRENHNHHPHHHPEHETTDHVTNAPQTTKSLCDPGCELMLQPFHFCVCKTSTTTAAILKTTLSKILKGDLATSRTGTGTQTVSSQYTTDEAITSTALPLITTDSVIATASATTASPDPITPSTQHTTTQATIAKVTDAPTQNICDILCAQQIGGDACHCSKPGLPG